MTDAGLAKLNGLTNLVWLTLDAPKITDAGLAALPLRYHRSREMPVRKH
jgi:hypothetical protein